MLGGKCHVVHAKEAEMNDNHGVKFIIKPNFFGHDHSV
jgi:hypothetical protein